VSGIVRVLVAVIDYRAELWSAAELCCTINGMVRMDIFMGDANVQAHALN